MSVEKILEYISIFLALLIVLPVHEFAHAFAADKSGDYTPRVNGRYTLNPLAHFDVLGLIMFIFARFGWAKPVPVNPVNFKHYKLDSFLVAAAGIIANYITAFFFYALFFLSLYIPEFGYFTFVLQTTLLYVFRLSLVFCVFNLLPIYPLDGFRIIDCFIRRRGNAYYNYKRYGIIVLYVLIFLSFLSDYLLDYNPIFYYFDILGIGINYAVNFISIPITAFWGLIF